MRTIATGLAALGLIGGVGAVAYDDSGTPTVSIDDHGKKSQVTLAMDGGKSYSCRPSVEDRLEPHDITAGRITLTRKRVRRQERRIESRYPNHRAPDAVVDRYNGLVHRDKRLVRAYNAEIDKRNAILDSDCIPS
jgi:hypothetical protein